MQQKEKLFKFFFSNLQIIIIKIENEYYCYVIGFLKWNISKKTSYMEQLRLATLSFKQKLINSVRSLEKGVAAGFTNIGRIELIPTALEAFNF